MGRSPTTARAAAHGWSGSTAESSAKSPSSSDARRKRSYSSSAASPASRAVAPAWMVVTASLGAGTRESPTRA